MRRRSCQVQKIKEHGKIKPDYPKCCDLCIYLEKKELDQHGNTMIYCERRIYPPTGHSGHANIAWEWQCKSQSLGVE